MFTMGEIVKYQNDFNKLKLTNFNAMDLNVLMKICVELNRQSVLKIEIPFTEIKESIGYAGHKTKFINLLSETCKKIGCLEMWTDDGFEQIYLFKKIRGIKSREVLSFEINNEYLGFFLELQKQFTAFALEDFVKLESKYAKNLYRLLMQWKSKGHCPTEHTNNYFSLEEIRGYLNAPKDYEIKYLKRDILDPAVAEINEKKLFQDLELVVHKAKKRGAPVVGYSFTFTSIKKLSDKQKRAIEHKEIGDYVPAKELEKQKKSKQNRFNDFPQREYTNEQMSDLEKRLLGRT